MKRGIINQKISLSHKIFQYLLFTTMFSLLSFGLFWINNKVNGYKREVRLLKETYSDNKKTETKNKIILIKDYLNWIMSHPVDPISHMLKNHFSNISLGVISKGSDSLNLPLVIKDTVIQQNIPYCIIDKKGYIVYSSVPFPDRTAKKAKEDEKELLYALKNRNTEGEDAFPVYSKQVSNDSLLKAVIYFNSRILSGFTVATHISSDAFENYLKEICLDSISRIRYSKDEYIFINTITGKALASNGKRNQPPVDILASGDTSWISIFKVEQLAAVKPAGLFHTYLFKKISESKLLLKTSFFGYLPHWEWIIGTGFYEDDISSIIEMKRDELLAGMLKDLVKVVPFLLISILLSYLIVLLLSKQFEKNIKVFKTFFEKAGGERMLIDKSQVRYSEFETMAETANFMVEESIKAETELRISEERYRFLFERNPAPMFIYERGTYKILAVNEAFMKYYGYSVEEALLMSLPDLYPEEEKIPLVKLSQTLSGHYYAGEWHHIKKDGSVVSIIVASHDLVYMGREGRIVVITDITEHKIAEEKIRIREQQLNLIYSNIYDAVYYLSVEPDNCFRFISVNHAFLDYTGLAENQTVNKLINDVIPEPNLTKVTDNYKKAIQEKRTIQWEEAVVYPTGEKIGLVNITPLFDSNKKCTNLIGAVHDITELKKHELSLLESQQLFKTLAQVSPVGIFRTTSKGETTYVNPRWSELSGLSFEEAQGNNWLNAVHPDDKEKVIANWKYDLISHKSSDAEYRFQRKDGSVVWVIGNAVPEWINNEINGYIGTITDISTIKKFEIELLKAKEKAEESDRLKSAFLHNISHEVRTPMNAIVGFSELIIDEDLTPEIRNNFIQTIIKSSNQLLSIITQIISMASIEAGQEKIYENEVNLNSLVKLMVDQFSVEAEKKQLLFNSGISLPDNEAFIVTDETKLIQILSNLLSNAFKFTKQGSINFGYVVKNRYLEFHVSDTGIGIPLKMHNEIFERFRQVESTLTREYGGSGLGLSISKAYVELLGGKIWLTSNPGEGSEFYFTIPFNQAAKVQIHDKASSRPKTQKNANTKTILVAEDEDLNYMLLASILTDLNIDLIRAENGAEAVDLVKKNSRIDMVLMDLKLPVMDGFEATRLIKEYRPDLHVIAQTAYVREVDKTKALTSGCSDFISKPFKKRSIVIDDQDVYKY